MKNGPFNMDERGSLVICKICTVMYVLTLMSLIVTMFFRQFVFKQAVEQFEDMAVILTVNVLVMVSMILYLGGLTFQKFEFKSIITSYIVYVAAGFGFTFVKYRYLSEPQLSMGQIFGKLPVVLAICALITALFTGFAYMGKRKIDKELQ